MARACDRCSRLKTQCNGDLPCNRCQRLALECTQTRPILAKGRPKRDPSSSRPRRQNTSQRAESESASPQGSTAYNSSWQTLAPSEYSLELVRRLPELPVAEPVAAHLLDLVLSSISAVGILEVFSGIYDSAAPRLGFQPSHSKRINPSLATLFHSKALLYTLIALGATICYPPDPTINITSLQQYALNSVPALYVNSRDLKIDDALSLCFLSYMGCLNGSSLKVAERWAVLSVLISRQAIDSEGDQSPEWEAFRQRASSLIHINDRIFSLLHHRQPFDTSPKKSSPPATRDAPKSPPTIADKMSIGGVLEQPPEPPKSYMKSDYFSLFTPLLKPLDLVLGEPQSGSPESVLALAELEKYYLEFPLILISYNEIRYLHQVEAMVWFHGIFLLLDGKRDLYSCFEDKSWVSSPSFVRVAEHALLLGEAIPAVTRLIATASQLSPATVYFILLSSVVHSVMLRQCLGTSTSAPRFGPQADPDQASWTTLLESTRIHLFILGKIKEESSTCNIDLVPAVEAILQAFYSAATTGRNEWDVDFQTLKLYRWTERGRGIVKISHKVGEELSRLSVTGSHAYAGSNSPDGVSGKQEIMALCDPRTRRCRPGYFASSLRGSVK